MDHSNPLSDTERTRSRSTWSAWERRREAEVTETEADAEDEEASCADVGGRGTVHFRHVPSVAVI